MIGGIKLTVSYNNERTCFAYINSKYSTNKETSDCIQVFYRDRKISLWVVFSNNVPDRKILCNPMLSRLLGLEEGIEVFVSPLPNVKVLDELYINTDSPEDQEILEHNADVLQLRILHQLRLVVANQKAIIWVSNSMPIVFTPKRTGILMNQSRIIVKVNAFDSYHNHSSESDNSSAQDPKNYIKFKNIGLVNDEILQKYLNTPKRMILRAIPIECDGKKHLIHPYTVFVHEDFIDYKYKTDNSAILATMNSMPSILKENTETESSDVLDHNICVEIVPIDHIVFRSLSKEIYNNNIPSVLIPKSLNNIINIDNGMKLILNILGNNLEKPEHVHIITYSDTKQSEDDVIVRFKNCVIDNTHSGKIFLINSGLVKQNLDISHGFLQFTLKPETIKYTMLNSESFRHCTISAKCLSNTDLPDRQVNGSTELDFNTYCRSMKSIEELLQKVISYINFEIHREACFKEASEIKSNILITGTSGTGKSSVCHIVQRELTVWSHLLHCRSLKGRKDIPEVLSKAILMCQEHSPSVLICDDVDSLVPSSLEGASPQDIAYYQRLAVVIKHLLQRCPGVCVLMTSLSVKALHPTLSQHSGKPLFTAHLSIPNLDQTERVELFNFLLNDKLRKEFLIEDDDVIKMAANTNGYNIRDLNDYLNKKIFKAVKKKNSSSENMMIRLVEDVATDKTQADAFDIWGPVGGMEEVKQKLTELIFWPLMYPSLFPTQSCGILLYGPPGTGKSYIGSCLARLTNMNFISVKGPELLSKYIGQSEKAVRDIFDKAEMKHPCILFFDEFDSLAPKRGHDSTGVTDRVVNQLLARLDGAEGAGRTRVVAATARPDLVDAALLRPGRLSAHAHCALPDAHGRRAVLSALAAHVALAPSVELAALATRTEGFSPADLKALLVTAQLGALEKQLISSDGSLESVVVDVDDVESALAETKPSLSKEQLQFYETIYKRFRGETVSAEERTMLDPSQKQRVTLA